MTSLLCTRACWSDHPPSEICHLRQQVFVKYPSGALCAAVNVGAQRSLHNHDTACKGLLHLPFRTMVREYNMSCCGWGEGAAIAT